MSDENVELLRRFFAALGNDDLQTVLGLFDPDVEWSPTEGTFRGIEGVAQSFAEWIEPWQGHRIEPEEFVDCGDDQVLVAVHLSARGKHSGMEIDQRFFQIYTVKEGKIRRMVEYVDRARALEAAGMPE
jgi:uncharacterized protein